MTTKPDTDSGWSKEFPSADGYYWVRQPPHTPYLIEITDGFAAFFGVERMVEALSFKPDHEFAPISPSDFEQLIRLREAAEAALIAVRCPTPHCNDAGMYPRQINDRGDAEPEQCEFCETNPHSWFKTKAALRNALNPPTLSVL